MFALPKWITDIKKLFATADGKVLCRVGGAWQFLSSFVPSAHKSSHATGGSDLLTPADIGATDNSHDHSGGDGAQIDYASLGNIPTSFTPASHYQDASSVNVYTGNFAGNLSTADDTAQKALETLDALVAGGGGVSIPESVDPPESPEEGDLWIDLSEDPVSYPYLSNGNLVEKKVIPADCSSVTFAGLDSLVDGDYFLVASVPATAVSSAYIKIGINNDLTDANYITQSLSAYATTVASATDIGPALVWKDSGYAIVFNTNIKVVTGVVYIDTCGARQSSASLVTTIKSSIVKKATISSITSITLFSSVLNIASGSTFTLYKSNSAQQLVPYNPVDITSRTSDYPLKQGEVVYIDYVNATSVPLHVATQEGEYELTIIGDTSIPHGAGGDAILQPNNANTDATINARYNHYLGGGVRSNQVRFVLGYTRIEYTKVKISTVTKSKSIISDSIHSDSANTYWNYNEPSKWTNTTTPWTSLGTITFPFAQSGRIIIKRII